MVRAYANTASSLRIDSSGVRVRTPATTSSRVAYAAVPPPPVGRKPEVPIPELDPLLDVHTKRRALLAPLAVFVVAALAVIVFLATR